MKFSIIIKSLPSSSSSNTAIKFIETALDAGHEIYRVFFYQAGVAHANNFSIAPRDEHSVIEHWIKLKEQYELDLVVCVAAALRRGVVNDEEAKRYEKNGANLHSIFEISGLGQLVDASINSDRVISF